MTELNFREQCALVALERFADKMFDPAFRREAIDAGLDTSDLLASYCWELSDAMASQAEG